MNKTIIAAAILFASCSAIAGEGHKDRSHKPRSEKPGTDTQVTAVNQTAQASAYSRAGAIAGASASGGSGGHSTANATGGAGGNSSASGGNATATGGQVVVNGGGAGSGLTGRMVPDVSTTAPATSTSCRNGISAGGSGNGWGGLIGFFSEDELCEWRLLEANYRATGNQAEADAIRTGMTRQRCAKLSPEERENFGALCPKAPAKETPSPAFLSAG